MYHYCKVLPNVEYEVIVRHFCHFAWMWRMYCADPIHGFSIRCGCVFFELEYLEETPCFYKWGCEKPTYSFYNRPYSVVFVCGRCVQAWGVCRGQRLNWSEAGRFTSAGFFQELILLYVVENLLSDYRALKS